MIKKCVGCVKEFDDTDRMFDVSGGDADYCEDCLTELMEESEDFGDTG